MSCLNVVMHGKYAFTMPRLSKEGASHHALRGKNAEAFLISRHTFSPASTGRCNCPEIL